LIIICGDEARRKCCKTDSLYWSNSSVEAFLLNIIGIVVKQDLASELDDFKSKEREIK
jgi:hypothetical protein